MSTRTFENENSLGYVMKQAQHALRKKMDERLRDLELTVPKYSVLNALEKEPGASNAELARRAFITPQSMQGIISNLEKSNLIIRQSDPEHGRIQKAELTESGRKIISKAHSVAAEIETNLREAILPLEYEVVLAMLQRCRDEFEGS
ncbi:MAG: MarR family transcriptional regulator [Rhizobiaceae bacterium]